MNPRIKNMRLVIDKDGNVSVALGLLIAKNYLKKRHSLIPSEVSEDTSEGNAHFFFAAM